MRNESKDIELINGLMGLEVPNVKHVGTERCPYSEEGDKFGTLDLYADGAGRTYRIGGRVRRVVSVDSDRDADRRLPVSELRQIAIAIVGQQIGGFVRLLPSLHPLEANDRREVYYFRWEDLTEPLSEEQLPPFVQVGMRADGTMQSFVDTLSEILKAE